MLASRHLRTQTALARKSGVTQSTIGRLLRGEVSPQSENLERIALAFGMAYSELASLAEGAEVEDPTAGILKPANPRRVVPLLSLAQTWRFAEIMRLEQISDASEWIEFPKKRQGPRTIALKVSGESMEPEYHNADIIYIDPDVAPTHGKDIVVRLGAVNEVAFRRLVVESELRYLKPLNQNWPDKFIRMPTDARIVGVVVGRYKDI